MDIKPPPKGKKQDLGDLLGLTPGPEKDSAPSADSKETGDTQIDSGQKDLGNLMNIGPPVKEPSADNLPGSSAPSGKSEFPPPLPQHPKPGSTDTQHQYFNPTGPALWMLEPQQYPWILESFRTFKNKIALFKENEGLEVFLLTGSSGSIGVSTVVFNLGMVLGLDLADKRILLVDANPEKPVLHNTLGLSATPGLMDYIFNNLTLNNITQSSTLPNLDIVSIGQTTYEALSPFDLSEFSNFLGEIRQQYDYILIDSSPALQSSQTRIISSKVDGVVIVTEANKTRWEVVAELKRQLEISGARIVGSFLNKRRFVIPKWLYKFI